MVLGNSGSQRRNEARNQKLKRAKFRQLMHETLEGRQVMAGITITSNPGTIAEAGGTGTFTIVSDLPEVATIVFLHSGVGLGSGSAMMGDDYTATNLPTFENYGVFTMPANSSRTITITALEDSIPDNNEYISMGICSWSSASYPYGNGSNNMSASMTISEAVGETDTPIFCGCESGGENGPASEENPSTGTGTVSVGPLKINTQPSPNPSVSGTINLGGEFANAQTVQVVANVGGQSFPVTVAPASVGNGPVRINVPVPASAFGPGETPVSLQVSINNGAQTKLITGTQNVRQAFPGLPVGVWLKGLERLELNANSATLQTSTGSFGFLANGNGYTAKAGDSQVRTLTHETNGEYLVKSKKGETSRFRADGLPLLRRDADGNETSYVYIDADNDSVFDELSQIIGAGEITTLTYGSNGLVETLTDGTNRTYTYDYDANNRIEAITEPDADPADQVVAPVTTLNWNATQGRLNGFTDAAGQTKSYDYDAAGKISEVKLNGVTVRTLTSFASVGFIDTANGVGTGGNPASLLSMTNAFMSETDGNGHTTETKLNRMFQPIEVRDSLGNITTYERDSEGRIEKETGPDPDGLGPQPRPVTEYDYDTNGNTILTIHPDGSTESWMYDPVFNAPTSYTDQRGFVTLYQLDPLSGDVLYQRDVVGQDDANSSETNDVVTSFTYTTGGANQPPAGLLATTIDALGRETAYDYDLRGNQIQIRYAVGTSVEAEQNFVYNAAGLLVESRDELDRLTIHAYDGLNRLKKTTLPDPDGAGPLPAPEIQFEYDTANRLKKEIDPLGRVTEFVYDARGRKTQELRPDHDNDGNLTITTFTYNNADQLVSTTDPLGRVTTYLFDEAGRQDRVALPGPTGVYDSALSPVRTTVFNALGQVAQQIDPLGNVTKYTTNYLTRTTTVESPDPDGPNGPQLPAITTTITDPVGNIVTGIDPLGRTTTTVYDRFGRPIVQTQPDPDGAGSQIAPTTINVYDKVGNLRFVTDPLGNVTEYQYDARNRLVAVIAPDPDGTGPLAAPTTLYILDAAGQRTGVIDAAGNLTTYAYDGLGRQVSVTLPDPDGSGILLAPTTTYAYDAASRATSVTDPLGNITTYQYDTLDHRISITQPDPDGTGPKTAPLSQYAYDAAGQLSSVTDAAGNVTSYVYDTLGRQTSVTYPDPDGSGSQSAPVVSFTYDVNGNQLTVTDPLGHVTTSAYDAMGRRFSVSKPDPNSSGNLTTTYVFDVANQVLSVTDAAGRTTSFGYDLLGRRISETLPDPDGSGSQSAPVTTITYDAVGNLLTTTDPLGKVTTNVYDNLYRHLQTQQPDPDGTGPLGIPTTNYTYDSLGNRLSLTDPVGNTTTWTYDNLSRVSTQTNQLGYAWAFQYDAVGNLLSKIDRQARVIVYDYDNLYRRTDEEWFEALGSTALIGSLHYEYDVRNLLISVATTDIRDGQTLSRANYFTYDNLGRTISETQNPGLSAPAQFDTTYDLLGNRTSVQAGIFENATLVPDYRNDYAYDALSRLTQIQQHGVSGGNAVAEKQFDFTYNAAGQFSSLSRYADLGGTQLVATTDYAYDNIGRLTDLHHQQGATSLARYQYAYDSHNRITSINSLLDGVSTYNYDNTDQLTGADHTTQGDENYGFDLNGNRTMAGHVVGANNQLLSDGVYNYTYDAEGNRASRTNIATGERIEYSWDNRNRLVRVTDVGTNGAASNTGSSSSSWGYSYGSAMVPVAASGGSSSYGYTSGTGQFATANGSSSNGSASNWMGGTANFLGGNANSFSWSASSGDGINVYSSNFGEGSSYAGFGFFNASGITAEDITIDYWIEDESATEGTDFILPDGTVTIPAGGYYTSFNYAIVDDSLNEGVETFILHYRRAGTTDDFQIEASIVDNDYGTLVPGSFGVSYNSAVNEGDTFAFNILTDTLAHDAEITVTLMSGTATTGADVVAGPFTFVLPAGTSWNTFDIATIEDLLPEGNETFTLQLQFSGSNSSSLPYDIPLTIYDDENPTTVFEPGYFNAYASASIEGNPIDLTIGLNRPYNSLMFDVEVTVTLVSGVATPAATAGDDFAATSFTFTIPAYAGYVNFQIPTFDDALIEGKEQFFLRLQFTGPNASSDPYDISLELADNDATLPEPQPAYLNLYAWDSVEGAPITVYPYLSFAGPTLEPLTLTFSLIPLTASFGTDLVNQTFVYTIPAGSYYYYDMFNMATLDDLVAEGVESFIVRMELSGNGVISNPVEVTLELADNEEVTPWVTVVDYYYDDQNRLISRNEQHADQPLLDKTTAFYYGGKQVVLKAENGLVVDRLTWGPVVDQLLADEQIDWTDPQSPESEVLWPLGDHLNSNRDLAVYDSLTETTVVANHIIYDSFGNLISQSGGTFVTDWRWTGRWFDSTTGLQYNWHRWYDPRIGQWTSEDPYGFPAGDTNLRRYVQNKSISHFDPDGRVEQPSIGPPTGSVDERPNAYFQAQNLKYNFLINLVADPDQRQYLQQTGIFIPYNASADEAASYINRLSFTQVDGLFISVRGRLEIAKAAALIDTMDAIIALLGGVGSKGGGGFVVHPYTGPKQSGVTLGSRQGLEYDTKFRNKHLEGTREQIKELKETGSAHVFKDEATLNGVAKTLLVEGEFTGFGRFAERYGKFFDKPIGTRIDKCGNRIPLRYGELKLDTKTNKYHVIPRTGPTKAELD